MEGKQYDEAYVNMLKEELESSKHLVKVMMGIVTVAKQCIIRWDWDQMFEFPEGRSRPVELHELVQRAIEENYRIISIVITEYDEAGEAMHGFIVALHPEGGKLH